MINLSIVRGACQALLDQGMLFCITKILIISSDDFCMNAVAGVPLQWPGKTEEF